MIARVEFEEELYAERVRRKAQAERLASGEAQWTDQLDSRVRSKLSLAWEDLLGHIAFAQLGDEVEERIARRTLRSIGFTIRTRDMPGGTSKATNEQLLSLIEAEHEALTILAEAAHGIATPWLDVLKSAPETFRKEVNRAFEAHLVAFHLHHNSRLVPIESHEMHNAVVEPTLYLLHSQPHFASAEVAYQNALRELRDHESADAITDAAAALQDVLKALGCKGNVLGALLTSARSIGLLKGNDTPLTEAVVRSADWVAAKRNLGEAHTGDPDIDMSDAWMVVHVVGALIIRLSEAANVQPRNSNSNS